jgi:hypothetical protein
VISFDNHGSSGHIKHIYLSKAVKRIKKQLELEVKESKAEKKD